MDFSNGYRLPQQAFGVKISLSLNGFSTRQKINQSELQFNLRQEQLENTKLVKLKEDELLRQQVQEDSQQLEALTRTWAAAVAAALGQAGAARVDTRSFCARCSCW